MFHIAPHGKTIIAQLPFAGSETGASVLIPFPKIGDHVSNMQSLIERFAPETKEGEHQFDIERVETGLHLTYRYPPQVGEGGKTCMVFMSMPEALNLSRRMEALGVRTRTRTRPAPATPAPRKRVRPNG